MNSSEPHRETALRLLSAFKQRDLPTLQALIAPEAVLHVPGQHAIAGEKRGLPAILDFFARMAERSEQTVLVNVKDVLASPDHAVALCTITATRLDRSLHNDVAYVMRFQRGQLLSLHMHNYDQDHVNQFWA
ncbi:nuclear transport factor 2 family protein [Deinococcus aquatilis]|uniref:nuclear transport factor 2 family protein n=1 Tax=Deinococcus aquatilis TaxID=519440 RepID=UPI00037846DB|nr:nuclear transport factor 2 family protein [Deinococcus aquatilis]